jgi:glc operon protein GlcG
MKNLLALIGMTLLAAPTAAQTPSDVPAQYGTPISAEAAIKLLQRGVAESTKRGDKMAIAIVEPSGELVAFIRMDNAPYASIRLSQQKARTAARLRIATATLEQRVLGGRTVLLSSDEVIAIGGGLPIIVDGKVVGAIGISGATAAEDAATANALLVAD